jgi:hypothetical protein
MPSTTRADLVVDVGHHAVAKRGGRVCGDTWLVRRLPAEGRLVCVLSDGLGSGVKANVLATLTATIAVRHAADERDPRLIADVLRRSLPVCAERGISYATFTILDVADDGRLRLVEYGNPPCLLLRGGDAMPIDTDTLAAGEGPGRELRSAELRLVPGDRVLCVSDGVTQAGMGAAATPLGWGSDGLAAWARNRDDASAADLAEAAVTTALAHDVGAALDDTTAGVLYLRAPRRLLVVTGAPYDAAHDALLAEMIRDYPGRTAVCGGTTGDIVARELGVACTTDLAHLDPEVPPPAIIPGVTLATEGMITLTRTLAVLEGRAAPTRPNAATRLAALMRDSDLIDLRVGTRINEAHQDPTLPLELGIRRNLVQRLADVLRERHAKQVTLAYT